MWRRRLQTSWFKYEVQDVDLAPEAPWQAVAPHATGQVPGYLLTSTIARPPARRQRAQDGSRSNFYPYGSMKQSVPSSPPRGKGKVLRIPGSRTSVCSPPTCPATLKICFLSLRLKKRISALLPSKRMRDGEGEGRQTPGGGRRPGHPSSNAIPRPPPLCKGCRRRWFVPALWDETAGTGEVQTRQPRAGAAYPCDAVYGCSGDHLNDGQPKTQAMGQRMLAGSLRPRNSKGRRL
ncbi:hypothetical protein FPV67DRAFT_1456415 [Lyophyllum atratum]|nr:hypothetical protein FPV67DRAFT_1456415 [Lyophyllum atratum]